MKLLPPPPKARRANRPTREDYCIMESIDASALIAWLPRFFSAETEDGKQTIILIPRQ